MFLKNYWLNKKKSKEEEQSKDEKIKIIVNNIMKRKLLQKIKK